VKKRITPSIFSLKILEGGKPLLFEPCRGPDLHPYYELLQCFAIHETLVHVALKKHAVLLAFRSTASVS